MERDSSLRVSGVAPLGGPTLALGELEC